MNKMFCVLVSLLFTCITIFAEDKPERVLQAYKAPSGVALNTDYTVKVRLSGKAWQTLPVYLVKVDEVRNGGHQTENASMAYFDFEGEVEVSVTWNMGVVKTARVRPLSYNIPHRMEGRSIYFKLNKPANLSLEVNDDLFHNLHLFANPVQKMVVDKNDTNLIYFGPGVHEIPGQVLSVPSGKTVFVAGGAVLKGQLLVQNASHVRILGSGMVDQSIKMGIRIANSKNVQVEGLFATQCFTGGSDSVTIRNVKVFSYYGWGDGMNVISSRNVIIDRVFNRNSDDCTTVYGTRLGFTGGCSNILMENSTLWADVGHPILIGTHGNTPHPDTLENLSYQNIDILDQKEQQLDYQGCMSINAGDNNLVRQVRFENVRVENFRQGQLLNIRVFYNRKYCTSPGQAIEDVLFKNVSYRGTNAEISIIAGYNDERKVKNIRFENLVINGVKISDNMKNKPKWFKTADMAGIFLGEHVEGVVFE
jgi:hypothetical protein